MKRERIAPVRRIRLSIVACLWLALLGPVRAEINVTVTGPGGSGNAVLPDEGGSFAVDLPLNRNAVNPITVTATDSFGQVAEAELAITQLSLDQIVVSRVTTERLSIERVEELVADGVIELDDPENYNVSEFAIVLTIDKEPVPISIPLVFPKGEPEPSGSENVKLPPPDDPNLQRNRTPRIPPEIIVFAQEVTSPEGLSVPPIPGVIVIEGRIKSLKEFFSVRLLLLNSSGLFTLSNVMAEIEFPDGGLSNVLPADGFASFGDILAGTPDQPGQVEKEFIVRGDEIGVHDVKLNFGGTVTGPGIPEDDAIPFNGSAVADVEVKGPPTFQVTVHHPDEVEAGVPYDLEVEILNTGELPAMYASLELDVSADAMLANCVVDEATGDINCDYVTEPVTRALGHIRSGERVSEVFTVLPEESGRITSCVGGSDQNISLQVVVGTLGCVAGHYPPAAAAPDGIPTVNVVPVNNAQGISVDSPVVAFFSEHMSDATIHTGSNGTFNVYAEDGELVEGLLRIETNLSARTMAIWQVNDRVLNRWRPAETYTVVLTQGIRDRSGTALFNAWSSTFKTTTMGAGDVDPPLVTFSVEPPVDPGYVLPGELVRLNAYASDQGSGVARVELRIKDLAETNVLYRLIDQKSVFDGDLPPYIFTLDSAELELGHTYQLMATAYDGMANLQNSTLAITVAPSAAPPTIDLPPSPVDVQLQGVFVSLAPDDVSQGVRTVRYYLDGAPDPYKTAPLPPFKAGLPTLELGLTSHVVQAVAEDGLGQTAKDTYTFTLVENPSMPVVSFPGSVDGEIHVQGDVFVIDPDVDDEVGIREMAVYLASPVTNLVGTTAAPVLIDTTAMETGLHHLIVLATNHLGTANDGADPDSHLAFLIVEPGAGPPPSAPTVDRVSFPDGGEVTVTGTSVAGAEVIVNNLAQGIVISVHADGAGAFRAVVPGDAGDALRIVAYDHEISMDPSGPTDATVPVPPALVEVGVDPAYMVLLTRGAHRDLVVTGRYDNGAISNLTGLAAFSSDDPGVASVGANGRVVAVARGEAHITAAFGGWSSLSTARVDIVSLTNLVVAPADISLVSIGETRPLSVVGQYDDGTQQALPTENAFVSGDPGIATVSGSGVVEAVADGVTEVTVYRTGVQPVSVPVRVATGADPAPVVEILGPAPGSAHEPGDTVPVSVRATDATGGVVNVHLSVTGAATFEETRQVAPGAGDTTQVFNFPIPPTALIGGLIQVTARAVDTSGNSSMAASVTVSVGDLSTPVVHIVQPIPETSFAYGDQVDVMVQASDLSGVTQIAYRTTGALAFSGTRALSPPVTSTQIVFSFTVPFAAAYPNVVLHVEAWDTDGNREDAVPVPIVLSDADVIPPTTEVTAVADPGGGVAATVTYEVTEGLDDLDYVAIYFRRDGFGTFNRYTDAAGGSALGQFAPSAGTTGTMVFDSTRMGGDGLYEFYSVGVDRVGNREMAPTNGADEVRAFSAGTAWVVVSNEMTVAVGDTTYDGVNLRIDGASVTLDGHHVFHNVELVNGAVLTHPETTLTIEPGLDVEAWTFSIDSNSSVNVDARGYLGGNHAENVGVGQGRTYTNGLGSTSYAGGSYGGIGGVLASGVANALYGDLTAPFDLGSGGALGANSRNGGDGGGRTQLRVINLVNDGSISAQGSIGGGGWNAGGGSGGSVYLVLSTLSGIGGISANGDGLEVGGGGGRVAVHYIDMATYDEQLMQALGGQGSDVDGGNGTVFLRGVDEGGGTLVVDGQGVGTSYSALPIPPGYVFDNIIIRNSARVLADDELIVSNRLQVLTGSVLTHSLLHEDGLRIRAARVEVDDTSSIDATGKGYRGGLRDGNASATGETLYGQPGATTYAGGSYGGAGAENSTGGTAPVYGHPGVPVHLGAGGGNGGNNQSGGNGGGRIDIEATSNVDVRGAILADGGETGAWRAGGGSGGSIRIATRLLRGNGEISADGSGREVGGGGGRIAIDYAYTGEPGDDLDGFRNIHAFGYHVSQSWGGAGTVLMRRHDQTFGDLYVDDNISGATSFSWTPLTHVGFGTNLAVTADTIQTDGVVEWLPGGLVGLEFNPNVEQDQTFTVVDNTATSLTVDVGAGVLLTDVAGPGDPYAAVHRFDNLYFRRGGVLVAGDQVKVEDTVRIEEHGKLTHFDATTNFTSRIDLAAGTVEVASNGFINADGRGYLGGLREENAGDIRGRTQGNLPGSTLYSGGSYGGLGAPHSSGTPNALYGSLTQPGELGSGGGGGGNSQRGGDGGGSIRVTTGSLLLDGVISANGSNGGNWSAGGGSGGTISIEAGVVGGTGHLRANGGAHEVGGGGGRVAVRFATMTFAASHIEARGGQGSKMDGGNGTLFLKQAGQAHGNLVIDGHGYATPEDLSWIPGGYAFDGITLRNGARVTADEGLTSTGLLSLENDSVLTHSIGNEDGLEIRTDRIEIDAASGIDVTGRGYPGGLTPLNAGQTAVTLHGQPGSAAYAGGSYGGVGATLSDGRSNPVYGHPAFPIYLGSGGAGGANGQSGGHGGGRVSVTADTAVTLHGAIRADGLGGGTWNAGGGSGGSVVIDTVRLDGTGTVSADGGGNEIGGGGGRIAVVYDTLGGSGNDLAGLRNIHAFGAHRRDGWGGAGTVMVRHRSQAFGNLYIDDHLTNATSTSQTLLTPVGFGTVRGLSSDTLATDGTRTYLPGALVDLEINPNLDQGTLFTIIANTATTIVVDVSGGTNLTDVASVGDTCSGVYRFDNVFIRRGGFLWTSDRLAVSDTLRIAEYGTLTHQDATTNLAPRLDLLAGSVVVEATGTIDVSSRGYLGGLRAQNAGISQGRTLGHVPGSTPYAGGSHGGLGAERSSGVANPLYGHDDRPDTLGSGGSAGANSRAGGDGGGRIGVLAGALQVDGDILADGGAGGGWSSGGGSGGSIYVRTGALTGTGTIRAAGGSTEVGGGGGRIALYYPDTTSNTNGLSISIQGGPGTSGDSGLPGVLYVDDGYVWDDVLLELHAGPLPETESVSGLRIQSLSLVPDGTHEITWEHAGLVSGFTIEFSPELTGTNWVPLKQGIEGAGWTVEPPAGGGFYRVREER